LPADVTTVSNADGLTGGIQLWRKDPTAYAAADVPEQRTAAPPPEGARPEGDPAGPAADVSGAPDQPSGVPV
jgi:hypothetical protein